MKTQEIDQKRVDRHIQTSEGKLTVLKPIIDYISIGLPTRAKITKARNEENLPDAFDNPKDFWTFVYANIDGLCSDEETTFERGSKYSGKHYKSVCIRLPSNGRECYFNYPGHYKDSGSPGTLMLPGSDWTNADLFELIDLWSKRIALENYYPLPVLLSLGGIKRLDIAVDVLGLRVADVFPASQNLWKIWAASSFREGFQTVNGYISSVPKSPFQDPKKRSDIMLYDRRQKLRDEGKDTQFGDLEHTRIECSKVGKIKALKNVKQLSYPFRGYHIWRVSDPPKPFTLSEWRMFIDSARVRGFENAEALLPKDRYDGFPKPSHKALMRDIVSKKLTWKYWPEVFELSPLKTIYDWSELSLEVLLNQQAP